MYKMNKLIFLLILFVFFLFNFYLISAEVYPSCGGDNELVIGCIGDEELFFSGESVTQEPIIGGGYVDTTPAEVNKTVASKEGFSDSDGALFGIVILIVLVMTPAILLYLFFKKKSKNNVSKIQNQPQFHNGQLRLHQD